MAEQKFLVFSNPTEGREDEYNTWYDDVHLGDVQRVPGVTGAARYDLAPTGGPDAPAHRYLAVYDLDPGADPAAVLAELFARFGGPDMAASEAIDLATISMSVWRPRA
jgi:tricorn protease-like protein